MSDPIVIVEGARTAIGTYGGCFKDTPAFELGAATVRAALERSGVSPAEVDEVILGCVGQVGPEAFNARRVALAAGLPVSSNAYNVNRLCCSGLQAIWSAARRSPRRSADRRRRRQREHEPAAVPRLRRPAGLSAR